MPKATKWSRERGECRVCGHPSPLTQDGVVLSHWPRAEDGTAVPGECQGVGKPAVGHEPARYNAWRDRFESGDTVDDVQRLKLAGWQPVDGMPKHVADPFSIRCVRCGAEMQIVLDPLTDGGTATPASCRHKGREARPLTPEERRELREIRKELILKQVNR
ncbi:MULTISPECIES: hypothetical protein [unclassified Streptomyces]|uniref:hypothetical protein n=1 Tax=unclassified Streptomyces TaxID=2593676 RepID=UPI0036E568CC